MTPSNTSIIPALRYRKATEAIEWLCSAFGFEKHLVVPGENDTVAHAQLTLGNSMIMLSSVQDSEFGHFMKQPDEIDGAETQSNYILVDDADKHYAKAKAAGAVILMEIKDQDYGGRGYTCRDLEGHIWSIGTYDPWKKE
jgi:uncharacterized glyoxalase superfamily protein PhnB